MQPTVGKAAAVNREMLDEDGKQLTTLQFLERAVEQYDRVRPGTATADSDGWPELTDLSQLVKYRVLSKLPAPPAGQKFVLDPKTRKVSLVSQ